MITMIKYIADLKKLLQEGIRQAKEEDILPSTFQRRIIPLGKYRILYILLILY